MKRSPRTCMIEAAWSALSILVAGAFAQSELLRTKTDRVDAALICAVLPCAHASSMAAALSPESCAARISAPASCPCRHANRGNQSAASTTHLRPFGHRYRNNAPEAYRATNRGTGRRLSGIAQAARPLVEPLAAFMRRAPSQSARANVPSFRVRSALRRTTHRRSRARTPRRSTTVRGCASTSRTSTSPVD